MVAMNSTLSDFSFLAIGYNAGLDFARYTSRNGLRLRVRPRRDAAKADGEQSAVISRHRVEAPAFPGRGDQGSQQPILHRIRRLTTAHRSTPRRSPERLALHAGLALQTTPLM